MMDVEGRRGMEGGEMKAREGRSANRRIQRTLMRQINHSAHAALPPQLQPSGVSACTCACACTLQTRRERLGNKNQCKQTL